ncbi:MAG: anti-sigma F factor [Peptococcia bacterium]
MVKNRVKLEFPSIGDNVALARITIAALASQHELTLNDLEEIKVATSEAVSNAIIHGYQGRPDGIVQLIGILSDDDLIIEIIDEGIGIDDINQALQPAFSSDPERMGLGFIFMQSFMDEVIVESELNEGTRVVLKKRLAKANDNQAVS